jgi:chitin disaccharide deacetylase
LAEDLAAPRLLVTNADDFGFTRDVNEGIVEAHQNGILTSTTLMANGEAFEHAARLAQENPTLDVGVHVVLIGGYSLVPPYRALPANVPQLLGAVATSRIRVYEEVTAQVRRVVSRGITPTHLDTHKHTHLLPSVLDAVARVSREFGIPWVRRPFDVPMGTLPPGVTWVRRATSDGLQFLRRRFDAVLQRHNCRTTDHFAGFQITGIYRSRELAALIRSLPAGSTEFMCHPGYCREHLLRAQTRLRESREAELRALLDPEVREAVAEGGVRLTSFRRLGAG